MQCLLCTIPPSHKTSMYWLDPLAFVTETKASKGKKGLAISLFLNYYFLEMCPKGSKKGDFHGKSHDLHRNSYAYPLPSASCRIPISSWRHLNNSAQSLLCPENWPSHSCRRRLDFATDVFFITERISNYRDVRNDWSTVFQTIITLSYS